MVATFVFPEGLEDIMFDFHAIFVYSFFLFSFPINIWLSNATFFSVSLVPAAGGQRHYGGENGGYYGGGGDYGGGGGGDCGGGGGDSGGGGGD